MIFRPPFKKMSLKIFWTRFKVLFKGSFTKEGTEHVNEFSKILIRDIEILFFERSVTKILGKNMEKESCIKTL